MPTAVTLGQLALRFAAMPLKLELAVKKQLKTVGMKVRDDATRKLGTYQPAIGPYPAWRELAPFTIMLKAKAGGLEDPLIGHYPKGHSNKVWPRPLRTTLESFVESKGAFLDMAVHIGTQDPLGRYHEYGNDEHLPPRPFLRPAAFENEAFFHQRMEIAWIEAIAVM